MKVEKTTKTDEGTFKFSGEISEQEHDFVMSVGLNFIYAQGLISQLVPNLNVEKEEEEIPDDGQRDLFND